MPAPLPIRFSVEKLREMLDYSAETGEFRWKISPAPSVRVGDKAGYLATSGGEFIMIDYKPYAAARLAWMYHYGASPVGMIRHINGVPADNRIANLKIKVEAAKRPHDISQEQLREELYFDEEEGCFYWKHARGGPERIDADGVTNRAGTIRKDGYVGISALGFKYLVHRLAWFYVKGVWPEHWLDHKNGDRTDNRIENLREASALQNSRNTPLRSDNRSGYKGVSYDKVRKKWVSRIVVNYRQNVLGYFDNMEDAIAAYGRASVEHHGDFARPAQEIN
jgi:HNH endonuclease/AP2 domain